MSMAPLHVLVSPSHSEIGSCRGVCHLGQVCAKIFDCFDNVNGHVSTTSFSVCLLVVCRKDADFYKSVVYLSLAKICCKRFLVEFFGNSYIQYHIICKQGYVTSFPICITLTSFSCLVQAGASTTVLKRSEGKWTTVVYLTFMGFLQVCLHL